MEDEDLIPLSALQHYLYCPRQCALIHVERIWTESVHTAEGRLLHQRSDTPGAELRHGVRTVTAMPLRHDDLGIAGVADVVEFHVDEKGAEYVLPVEYKRGRPKPHRADEVQLCAQALCLEQMLNTSIAHGMLFYGKTRRRMPIVLDDVLRALTLRTIADVRAMIDAGSTPSARYEAARCDACSLIDDCQPHWMHREHSVSQWLSSQLGKE